MYFLQCFLLALTASVGLKQKQRTAQISKKCAWNIVRHNKTMKCIRNQTRLDNTEAEYKESKMKVSKMFG